MLICNKSTLKTHPLFLVVNVVHLNKIKYLHKKYTGLFFFIALYCSCDHLLLIVYLFLLIIRLPEEINQWEVSKGIKAHCILFSWLQRFLRWNICWFAELYLFKGDHLSFTDLDQYFLFNFSCLCCYLLSFVLGLLV